MSQRLSINAMLNFGPDGLQQDGHSGVPRPEFSRVQIAHSASILMKPMKSAECPSSETRVNKTQVERYKLGILLLLLSAAALFTHGYHPYVEDAEIYLPGVERILSPRLFPVDAEFFQSHANMTLFPYLAAWSIRVTQLPLETALLVWHVASIFLLLLACWKLSGILFSAARARWGAVCLIAALLTMPVSGTALYIMDQYLNPRNLAAFAAIFAVSCVLEKKLLRALVWVIVAGCVHPLMWVFPFSFCMLWIVLEKFEGHGRRLVAHAIASPVCLALLCIPIGSRHSLEYEQAAKLHANHYIQHWYWYEWVGIVAPIILLWCFATVAHKQQWQMLSRASRAFAIYGVIYLVVALALDLPARFERLARVQPLRSLHLEYVFLFLCIGGLLGEYVLRDRAWRWLALFVPVCLLMFLVQRSLFPQSAHVEWPGHSSRNRWAQAFIWIRQNTPEDALFAVDPGYMHIAGEDEIGFRCLAQRSRLADAVKDNGVVSMFPQLAEEWWTQVQAQTPWKNFQAADFAKLREKYGVTWVVLEQPGIAGLACKYQNQTVRVCQLD